MGNAHFFIAVPLDPSAKKVLHKWKDVLKDTFPFKTWVHDEDYHITLAFLGDSPKDKLQSLKRELKGIAKTHESFSLRLTDLQTFGPKEKPRIFWVGSTDPSELFSLQKDVFASCVNNGFQLDKKPFRPHITLARRWNDKKPYNKSTFTRLEEFSGEVEFTWPVDHIVLYQTHLDRSPKYEAIDIFDLGKR